MKIGILTFHFGINYGGVIQCYALQEYLEQHGHSVYIINFIPSKNTGKLKWIYRSLKQLIKKVFYIFRNPILYKYRLIQKYNFKAFRDKYLNLTQKYKLIDFSQLNNEFDAIIVGSDQIWNKAQRDHAVYFLTPFSNFNGLRISYAANCCINNVETKHRYVLMESLKKFHRISVRDIETYEFVNDLTNIKPFIAVDPVLLIDLKKVLNRKKNGEKFILAYILGTEIDGDHNNVIKQIKKRNNDLPIYAVMLSQNNYKKFKWADKTFWHVTVEEWLWYFSNASFIYTDSFHGVLFSLKFRKKFLAYYKDESRSSRFIDLMMRYKLDNNIVNSYREAIEKNAFEGDIDYERLQPILLNKINESKRFLKEALM